MPNDAGGGLRALEVREGSCVWRQEDGRGREFGGVKKPPFTLGGSKLIRKLPCLFDCLPYILATYIETQEGSNWYMTVKKEHRTNIRFQK